jgi:hypothetical protein
MPAAVWICYKSSCKCREVPQQPGAVHCQHCGTFLLTPRQRSYHFTMCSPRKRSVPDAAPLAKRLAVDVSLLQSPVLTLVPSPHEAHARRSLLMRDTCALPMVPAVLLPPSMRLTRKLYAALTSNILHRQKPMSTRQAEVPYLKTPVAAWLLPACEW